MNQIKIDFAQSPPASSNADPYTSDLAESQITRSGRRANQARQVLDALMIRPGHTSAELADHMCPGDKDWRYTVARRLPDLKNHTPQLATQCGKRICQITGKLAVVWYPSGGADRVR